ncbi:hypothetical protein DAEQUDRAFT_685893 [Daedalea quercina L-15889]|uniref:Ubiquitin-like domain-containing protein n=1 Tax=Daedalea quercina L-15889 TaxID=1314783 RepID=A0A165SZQ1_9APHY|nr:hypothetical protein DAEQUDRAFT_685893 [Daedalea quercina L-15889]
MSAQGAAVDIRIELPTYSRSFIVQARPSSTIRDVKLEITRVCPGGPRADGQRLIHKGRFVNDDELVGEIWKKLDEVHVLHLSVHPSAWTDGTPTLPSSSSQPAPTPLTVPLAMPGPLPVSVPFSYPITPPVASPSMADPTMLAYTTLGYVYYKHASALSVFMNGTDRIEGANVGDTQRWRAVAIEMLGHHGWAWPALLDEEYPQPTSGGLKYERTTVDGLPYLSLTNPGTEPTPIQVHAFKVLSLTFTILSTLGQFAPPYYHAAPTNVAQNIGTTNLNEHLQRLGLPALRLAPGQIPNQNLNPNDPNNFAAPAPAVEIRAIPLRAVLVPFLMVTFRTILLLYFFGPTKRPFFALLVMAWILYEAWGAIRLVLGHDRPRDRPQAGGADVPAGNPAGQPGPQAQGQQPNRAPRRPRAANANRSAVYSFLASLSNLNLRREDAVIDAGANVPPPSLSHKVSTFVTLMLLTLYPAVWDHRRAALRRREGRLRTEANAREAARGAEGEPGREADVERGRTLERLQQSRPAWVREYIERAHTTDWADEL